MKEEVLILENIIEQAQELRRMIDKKSVGKTPIDNVKGFSARTKNALKSKGIKYLEHLSLYKPKEIMVIRNIGSTTFEQIINEMKKNNIEFT